MEQRNRRPLGRCFCAGPDFDCCTSLLELVQSCSGTMADYLAFRSRLLERHPRHVAQRPMWHNVITGVVVALLAWSRALAPAQKHAVNNRYVAR
jgi:SPW repeat